MMVDVLGNAPLVTVSNLSFHWTIIIDTAVYELLHNPQRYLKELEITMSNSLGQADKYPSIDRYKYPICDEQNYIFNVNEAIRSIPLKISFSLVFSVSFSPEELLCAIEKCIETADIFGAQFQVNDGRTYMEFLPYQKRDIAVIDFASRDEYQMYCRIAKAEKINNRDKLYNIFIFSIAGSAYNIHLCFNHIVFDAISGLLLADRIQLALNNKDEEIVWHPYAAFLEKINHYYDSDKYMRDKEFWDIRFEELSRCQYLFPDVIDCNESATKTMIIQTSKAFKKALLSYCSDHTIPPHIAIVAVVARIISMKTGCKRFYVEIPIGNRSGNDEKNSIGTYEISPPFIFDFTTTNDVYDVIKSVKKQSVDYYKHKNYDLNTKILSEPYEMKYGRYIPQFCFSYFCENRKPPMSYATYHYYHSDSDYLPMTLHIADFLDWQTMTFSYMYWSACFTDDEIATIHKQVVAGLTELFSENRK